MRRASYYCSSNSCLRFHASSYYGTHDRANCCPNRSAHRCCP